MLDSFINGYLPFLIPFHDFIFSTYTPLIVRPEDLNPSIFTSINDNIGLLAAGVGAITLLITSFMGGIVWLKKQVTKENMAIRKETQTGLAQVKEETKTEINANRAQIANVETKLSNKIESATNVINVTLGTHKDVFSKMEKTMDKIEFKLDQNIQGYNRNVTRLDHHANAIDKLQDKVYGTGFYDHSSVKRTHVHRDDENESQQNNENR